MPPETESVCHRLAISYMQTAHDASMPAYLRIERSIHTLIAEGTLHPAQRLPSVRELAHALGVATNTAAHAYAELAEQGAIVSRVGGGTSVALRQRSAIASCNISQSAQPDERLRSSVRHLVAYSLALGHAPAEVIHAVRAELAALGRGEPSPTDQPPEIRPGLPLHAVPREVALADHVGRLIIEGGVRRPGALEADELLCLPRAHLEQAFTCDEGWVVPSLCWAGLRLHEVLSIAEPLPEATMVRVAAGSYRMPLSMDEVRAALLADELDGAPLSLEHGAPWRLIVPGAACYTSVKWVDRLQVLV
jgi:DNA-binding transcriptional regulator YhcF (GntR family)